MSCLHQRLINLFAVTTTYCYQQDIYMVGLAKQVFVTIYAASVLQLHIAPNKEINQDIKRNWRYTPTQATNVPKSYYWLIFKLYVGVCQDLSGFWGIEPAVSWWAAAWYKLLASPSHQILWAEYKAELGGGEAELRPLGIDWRPEQSFSLKPPRERKEYYQN